MGSKVSVIIEKDDFGYYAYCPEMPGCHSQGETLDEILANIKEAISLYLETLTTEELQFVLSKEVLATSVEVP